MESISYGDAPKAAQELVDYMSELSEDYTSTGWLIGLDRLLWEAVIGVRNPYEIPANKLFRLLVLAVESSSWGIFTDERGKSVVRLDDWRAQWQPK